MQATPRMNEQSDYGNQLVNIKDRLPFGSSC